LTGAGSFITGVSRLSRKVQERAVYSFNGQIINYAEGNGLE
jgi:hypothetical protein